MAQALEIEAAELEAGPRFLDWDDFLASRQAHGPPAAELYPRVVAGSLNPAVTKALRDWLEHNRAALDRLTDAVQRPHYWAPLIELPGKKLSEMGKRPRPGVLPGGVGGRLHLEGHVQLARALALRARLRMAEGNPDGACADLIALRRFAAHQSHGFFPPSGQAGRDFDAWANETLEFFLSQSTIDAEQLRWLGAHWEDRSAWPVPADRVGRRCVALGAMQKWWAGQTKTPVQINRALRRINHFYHTESQFMHAATLRFFEEVNQPWYDHWNQRFEEALGDQPPAQVIAQLIAQPGLSPRDRTDQIAVVILAATYTESKSASHAEFRHAAQECVARVALACARYRADHGQYPPHIFALMPAYLDAKPIDPIDGENIRYERTPGGFTVYSIGIDFQDDHGSASDIALTITHAPSPSPPPTSEGSASGGDVPAQNSTSAASGSPSPAP